ncbi:MAG: hypothetical protein KDC95_13705 [Planctomycetes bacterium]|nr:hypothetical protein [Planctomycetota bacterium]
MKQLVLLALPGICAALFFFPRPQKALRYYLLLLPFLPEFMVIKLGVSFTGSRIASIVFLLAMLYRCPGKLVLRIDRLDIVFGIFLATYLGAVVPGPPEGGAVFAAGFIFDIALPYWFVRAFVRTTEDLQEFVRGLLTPLAVICALAGLQSVTGFGLFDSFKTGDDVFGVYDSGMMRLGLVRADVGLTHYIMMGLFFASQLPIAIGHYMGQGLDFGRILQRAFFIPLGSFFSLSGGSFLVTGIGLTTWAARPLRKLWFLLGSLVLLGVVYIESFSNRGTLAILATFAATDGDSAWYRIRLPAAVFAKMEGHWWTGFGRDKPNMGTFNDITNHYLWWLMQGGLPCVLSFIGLFVVAFSRLYRSSQRCVSYYLHAINWGLLGCLLGLALGIMSVTLFGQMRTYLFLFIALSACSFAAAHEEQREASELEEELAGLADGEGDGDDAKEVLVLDTELDVRSFGTPSRLESR